MIAALTTAALSLAALILVFGPLERVFDQLVGPGRWHPRDGLGTFPIRFPHPDDGREIRFPRRAATCVRFALTRGTFAVPSTNVPPARLFDEMRSMALHDPLTGLPNVIPFLVLIVVMLVTPKRKLPPGTGRFAGAAARKPWAVARPVWSSRVP